MDIESQKQLEINRAELEMILTVARKYDVHKITFDDMAFELFPKPSSPIAGDKIESIPEPTREEMLLWSSPEGELTGSELEAMTEDEKRDYLQTKEGLNHGLERT
jgi:hypothetical protein